jgi:hypothetical protein
VKTEKGSLRKKLLPIFLIISILAAAAGWGAAISSHMTRTPRLDPDALETLRGNELMAVSDSALLQILERRGSTPRGGFTGNEISEDALQLLAWAATGKNREGTGFVVPLAMGAEPYVSLYLADEAGVRRFDWKSNGFENVLDDDIRKSISGGQNASAVFIYVIEKDKLPGGNMDWAWHTVGAMSEHQYLLADEFDIQARFMASVDANDVAALLGLPADTSVPAGVMVMSQK